MSATIERMTAWFQKSDAFKQIVAEQQEAERTTREQQVAAIAAAEKELAAVEPALMVAETKALEKFRAAEKAVVTTNAGLRQARGALLSARHACEGKIRRASKELLQSAHPIIDQACATVRRVMEQIQGGATSSSSYTLDVTGSVRAHSPTGYAETVARVDLLRSLIPRLDALKLGADPCPLGAVNAILAEAELPALALDA